MNFTLESLRGDAKTPHWYVNRGDKQWHVVGVVGGADVRIVSVSSRYFTEQTKSYKEVKLKQGTAAYEAAAKAARDFWLNGVKTAVTGAIAELGGAVGVGSPELAKHPIARTNAASWPSGGRARNSHFQRGQSTYVCRCCKHTTRQTGRGDNDGAQLCAECYDLGGEENHLNDNGEFYSKPSEVLEMIAAVAAKGDASCWSKLKAKAESMIAMTEAGEVAKLQEKASAQQVDAWDVPGACTERGWSNRAFIKGDTIFYAAMSMSGNVPVGLKLNACHAEQVMLMRDPAKSPRQMVEEFIAAPDAADILRAKEAEWAAESKRLQTWKTPEIPAGCQITVSSVKGHGNGMEGPRWSCKVQFKGQPAGEANEDGDGGPLRWRAATPAQGKAMEAYARSIGFDLSEHGNAEDLIATLVDRAKELTRFERLLKTNVILKLANGKVVQYKRASYTPKLAETVQAKNPGAVELTTPEAVLAALPA